MRNLLYVHGNDFIPPGRVSSTARLGDKWFHQVDVGDCVRTCAHPPGAPTDLTSIGYALIVAKEFLPLDDVLDNANHNHVAFSSEVNKHASPRALLEVALFRAYGDCERSEYFTVLHILPIAEHDVASIVAQQNAMNPPLDEGIDPAEDVLDSWQNLVTVGISGLGQGRVAAVEDTAHVGSMFTTRRVEFR